jgi:hypothetical protein
MLDFIDTVPVPEKDLAFFKTVPWASQLFSSASAPYRPVPFFSRFEKPDTNDLFFSRTIATSDTIPHCLLLLRHRAWSVPSVSQDDGKRRPFSSPKDPEVLLLFEVGPGMNGFAHTAHGGAMCSLLDETLGMCVETMRQSVTREQTMMYTAGLDVSFLAPVPTPAVLM